MRTGRRLLGLLGLVCLAAPVSGCNTFSAKHWSCIRAAQDNSQFTLHYGNAFAEVWFGTSTFSIDPLFDDLRQAMADTAPLTYLDIAVHNLSNANVKLDDVYTVSADGHQTVDRFVLAEQYMDDLVGRNNGYPDSTPAESALSEGWQAREPGSEQTVTAYGGELKQIHYVTTNAFPGTARTLTFSFDNGSASCSLA